MDKRKVLSEDIKMLDSEVDGFRLKELRNL